jgi:hypothetical protein
MLRAVIRALRTANQRINQTSIKGQSRVFQALIGILQTSIKANQSSIKAQSKVNQGQSKNQSKGQSKLNQKARANSGQGRSPEQAHRTF